MYSANIMSSFIYFCYEDNQQLFYMQSRDLVLKKTINNFFYMYKNGFIILSFLILLCLFLSVSNCLKIRDILLTTSDNFLLTLCYLWNKVVAKTDFFLLIFGSRFKYIYIYIWADKETLTWTAQGIRDLCCGRVFGQGPGISTAH